MTTIATDGHVMAADGRQTAGSEIRSETQTKLFELPDGSWVGGAGRAVHIRRAVRELSSSLNERREPEPTEGEYNILRLFPSGALALYDDSLAVPLFMEPPFAIGSGGEFARGALAAGASVNKAMKIAHTYDVHTGPLNQLIRVARR